MYHLPIRCSSGFHDGFRHGGMGMDRLDHFMTGGFEFSGYHNFSDHFGDIVADQMGSQQFAVFCIKDKFYKSFFVA